MLKKIWTVKLNASHKPYTHVDLKRSHDHVEGYEVVMVNVAKLMTCFEFDNLKIPPVSSWEDSKVKGICEFLNPQGGACDMPAIGFCVQNRVEKKLFGLVSKYVSEPRASFINGRHRSRYLQFAGAINIPVEIHATEAQLLREYCAATE